MLNSSLSVLYCFMSEWGAVQFMDTNMILLYSGACFNQKRRKLWLSCGGHVRLDRNRIVKRRKKKIRPLYYCWISSWKLGKTSQQCISIGAGNSNVFLGDYWYRLEGRMVASLPQQMAKKSCLDQVSMNILCCSAHRFLTTHRFAL